MILGKRARNLIRRQRRRSSQQHLLRLENLEHRIVFAGLSPVAVNDLYHATANEKLEISASGVLANDNDNEGDALTALEFRGPSNGSLTLNSDGSFAYTPDPNFTGVDGFVYQVDDGTSRSHLAVVTIQVTGENASPVAVADAYTIAEDTVLDVGSTHGVLANDSDPDGDQLQAMLATGPAHGTLMLYDDGSFTYQPDQNFHGSDAFTYKASDGTTTSPIVTVSLTVNAVNDAPNGQNDQYTVNEDTPLSVMADVGVLANDWDVDEDNLTVHLGVAPQHGELVLNSNGSFSYVPKTNFYGTDSFTYQISDGMATSSLLVVELMVNAVNDAPVGQNDMYTTNEDTLLTVPAAMGVLVNDSDVDNDLLTTTLAVGAEHGTVTLSANGSFTYQPATNFHGTDSFTYQVSDGTTTSDMVVVELTVAPVNDAPVGQNDTYTTNEDTLLRVPIASGVLANDNDVDDDPLIATIVDGAEHGAVTLNDDGSFTYQPTANFHGTDFFTYQISDGTVNSATVMVELMVNAVNDAPVGQNDSYTTNEDTPLTVLAATGVLVNDNDVDGDPLTATLAVGPQHGTVTLNGDGSFNYQPATNFHGTDSFTYQISDGTTTSDMVVVELLVNAVNDAPVGQNDTYTTNEDTLLSVLATSGVLINDSDVDGDPLTVTLAVSPEHGTVTLKADGSFDYQPAANFHGTDAFTYQISDGTTTSDMVVVELIVNAMNDAPVGQNDSYTTNEDTLLSVPVASGVLANDSDVDNDPLTATLTVGPEHGTLTLHADGSFDYQPAANYHGTDTFSYQLSDGTATSNTVVVELMINAVNDAPIGQNDAYTTNEDTLLTVSTASGVLINDSDVDKDALTVALTVEPEHGTVTLNADGSFDYQPAANFHGIDAFTYQISDGMTTSDMVVVELIVNSVNDAPVGQNDTYTTNEDTLLSVPVASGVLANDNDVDGDPLTVTLAVGPEHGTVTLNTDGSFEYQPTANYDGIDTFTYQISDGKLTSNTVVVELTVNAVNDAPVGQNDAYSTDEDTLLDVPVASGVLANDRDVDDDSLMVSLAVGPEHGTLTFNADGSFTYQPAANYHGTDAFTYQVSDGTITSDMVVVELTVNSVNDAPQAADDSYVSDSDQNLSIPSPGVLANDSDIDGDTLTSTIVDGPQHGTLTLEADGSFLYVPDPQYVGLDQFRYQASDGLASSIALVSIQVRTANERPNAVNDSYHLDAGQTLVVNAADGILRNDTDPNGDPLSAVLYRGPLYGVLALNPDGSFSYTPNPGFTGKDSFTYRAKDEALSSLLAVATLWVDSAAALRSAAASALPAIQDTAPKTAEDQASAIDSALASMSLDSLLNKELDLLAASR